jgi:ufm1-conjugating enzyme 1
VTTKEKKKAKRASFPTHFFPRFVHPSSLKNKTKKPKLQELAALIGAVKANKAAGTDWFTISPKDRAGHEWAGTAWATHELMRYRFEFCFEVPAAYPAAPPAIRIPALDGKTAKMYRGGAICLDAHFAPLWARHAPGYGLAHALALGLAPWLAAEVPLLAAAGVISPERG